MTFLEPTENKESTAEPSGASDALLAQVQPSEAISADPVADEASMHEKVMSEPEPTQSPVAAAFAYEHDDMGHITQESLQDILESHYRWVETDGKEGRRANFRMADLTHLDLSGLNMIECSFRGAKLCGVNMTYADLRTADLAEADLTGANLTGSTLAGANLVRSIFQGAIASQCDFSTTNMSTVRAANANFQHSNFSSAIMRDAHFEAADFSHALLHEVNMRGAVVSDAIFTSADLTNADCRDGNYERAHFMGAKLSSTSFKGSNLSGVEMDKADFSQAQDVSQEYQAESFNLEKAKLAEQQELVRRTRDEIAAREKKLQDEKHTLEHDRLELSEKLERIAALVPTIRKPVRWFLVTTLIWTLITASYAFLVYTLLEGVDLKKVKMVEFSIATGIMLGLFLLFFVSMLKAIQVQRVVKKVLGAGFGEISQGVSAAKPSKMVKEPKVFQSVKSVAHSPAQVADPSKQKSIASAVQAKANDLRPKGKKGVFGKK